MALRIRKSITLGTGVASDIQSTGGRARYELKPHGRRGTRRTWASAMPAPAWSIPAKPGLRAPRHERRRGTSGAAPSLRLGNEREALEDLEEIYELNPGYRDVARLLERETEASTDV